MGCIRQKLLDILDKSYGIYWAITMRYIGKTMVFIGKKYGIFYGIYSAKPMGHIGKKLWDILSTNFAYIGQKLLDILDKNYWDILGKNYGLNTEKAMGYIGQKVWNIV